MSDRPLSQPIRRAISLRFNGLWRQPEFMKLWAGQTISEFGSGLGALSLLAILVLDASPAQMGLLETLRAVPALVFGLFAGAWIDRVRRLPILISSDLGRGAILTVVAVVALAGVLRIEMLYLAAFLLGSLTLLFTVAYPSFLPSLVTRSELLEANGKLGVSDSLAEISAPGLGGLLVQIFSAPIAMLIDAVTFLISALFLGRIRAVEPEPVESAQSIKQDIKQGLGFLGRHRLLRPLALSAGSRAFFGGFFAALYSLFVIRELDLSPAILGLLIGSGGIGALAGALRVGGITARLGMGRTLTLSLFISGLLALLIPLAGSRPAIAFPLLLVGQLVGDFALTIYFITGVSLRQLATPPQLLGRVNASFEFLVGGAGTLGILAGGVIGQQAGIRPAVAVAAVGGILASLWLFFSPIRDLGHQDVADPHA